MHITKTFNEHILTVSVEGHLDTATSPELEREVFSVLEGADGVVLDFEKLEYISSSGLRVLLKIRKTKPDVQVINVSSEVYEILQVTGFTEMLEVKKAFRRISIEGCEKIGQGGIGAVYRLDNETIVKVYRPTLSLEEIERERQYARTAFVHGVPTAIAYDVVKVGDSYGTVYELMNSDTLAHALVKEPERWDELMDKYVALVRTLGETHVPEGGFDRIQNLLHFRCECLKKYLSEEDAALLHSLIDEMKDSDTLIHGDLHPGNVMLQGDELMLIDMADMTVGPHGYELSCLYRDMYSTTRPGKDCTFTEQSIGMPREGIIRVWESFITRYLGTEDPEKTAEWMEHMELLHAFNAAVAAAMAPVEIMERAMPAVKAHFLDGVIRPKEQKLRQLISAM
jgi:uncharacterized protein (TIGR02172 family)